MTDRGRGAWIGWSADRTGYTVTVYDSESHEIERYDAGNHPNDSQIFLALDSKERRVPLGTLRKFAKQTAGEFATQYGIAPVMIQDESGE